MAVAAAVFDETQRGTLAALCETFVPSVETDSGDPLEREFMGRSALDMQLPAQIEEMLADAMTPDELAAVAGLLDALTAEDLPSLLIEGRTEVVNGMAAADPAAKFGLAQLRGLTLLLFYALPDDEGRNPNWEAIGYPGPNSAAPTAEAAPKTISVEAVSGDRASLSADACIVGSGAGGSVIAAQLAAAGRSVLVLELGGYRNEQDFNQLEIQGMTELYYGGGLATSEDGSIAILAGSTLGGGTVVNYMNCIPTPERIVSEWAGHGLAGLDDYDSYKREHIDVVMGRINANTEATTQNGTHTRLMEALDALGMEHRPDRAQRKPRRRRGQLRLLPVRMSAGLQALGDEDVAAGRVGQRRAGGRRLPRRQDPRAGGRGQGRRGHRHPRRRLHHRAHSRGSDGRGGVRLGRVPGAAVALGHRRAGRRQAPSGPPGVRGLGRVRRAGRGMARPDPVARLRRARRPGGRLRAADRGHRHGAGIHGRGLSRGRTARPTSS